MSFFATPNTVAVVSGLSRLAATSFTMARFRPSDPNCCTVPVALVRRAETPIPSGPRKRATNLPRTMFIRIWNTCTPPNTDVPFSMLL